MEIQINTAAVSATADRLDKLNQKLRLDLSDVDATIMSLRQCWEGEASGTCVRKYDYIKNNYADARYSVVNDLVAFLKMQVGERYETTEQVATNAAAAFK